jgi:serine/threonine-protein kinase
MWADVDALCANLAVFGSAGTNHELSQEEVVFENFKDYLRFRGRGIPRRILRAFNEQVSWRNDSAYLAFPNEQLRRVNFYAQLDQLLEANSDRLFGRSAEDMAGTRYDRLKLGILYVIAWILRLGRLEFAASDVLTASRELISRIALAEQIAAGSTFDLLDILVEGEYIQPLVQKLDRVALDSGNVSGEKRYRLTDRRLAEMSGIGAPSEEAPPAFEDSESFRGTAGRRLGHYELHELLGQGGMGSVYHAWDTAARQFVALKLLHSWLINSLTRRDVFAVSSLSFINLNTLT